MARSDYAPLVDILKHSGLKARRDPDGIQVDVHGTTYRAEYVVGTGFLGVLQEYALYADGDYVGNRNAQRAAAYITGQP